MSEIDTETQEARMFAEDLRMRERRRRLQAPFWQTVSFILHGVFFIALVMFTPLREIVMPQEKPAEYSPTPVSSDQLEKISESLQSVRLNELLEQLQSLQIILHNMDMMKNDMLKDYDKFAASEQNSAKESLKEVFDRILVEQQKTLEEQKKALAKTSEISSLQVQNIADPSVNDRISKTLESARPAFSAIDTSQANSQNLMDKVASEAQLVGMNQTAEAAAVLRDVQLNANTMQREFQKNLENKVRTIADYPQVLKALPELKKASDNLKADIRHASDESVRNKQESEKGFQNAEALTREVSQKEAELQKTKIEADKKQAEQQALSHAENALREEVSQSAQAKAAAERATSEAASALKRAEANPTKKDVGTARAAWEAKKTATVEISKKHEARVEAQKQNSRNRETLKNEKNAADQKARSLDDEVRRKKRDVEEARRQAERNAQQAVREEESKKRLEQQLEKTKADIDYNESRKSEIEKMARTSAETIRQGQEDAITAQQKLLEKVRELAKLAEIEESKQIKHATEEYQPDPLVSAPLESLDIVEAYDQAKQLESKITESYRDVKSAEVAMLRKMSYESASKITDVAKVVRAEVDAKLLRDSPRDQATFDKQKQEAMKTVREADNMVETTVMLMTAALEVARPEEIAKGNLPRSPDGTILPLAARTQEEKKSGEGMERMYSLAGLNQEMSAAAAEDDSAKAKDMSKLMAQAGGQPFEGQEKAGVKIPGVVSALKSPLPPGLTKLEGKSPELFPGNIISLADDAESKNGVPAKWMYVNSWYVIGPFPNPDRVNIRRRFAPESVVDLDATYVGKGNKSIKWEFEQSLSSVANKDNRALVVPRSSEEYGIWYAYSEVFVDRDCDLWIAVGSDDRSDVWLNDMHVWGSSNQLKSWQINEGFRKVHFQKGRNRFLARIENGWYSFGWSMCISLTDDVAL